MSGARRKHNGAFKARVVIEAIQGKRTISEIASEYGIHPNQITTWKRQLLEKLPEIFSNNNGNKEKIWQQEKEAFLKKIGELEMERDWLQKKLNSFPWKKGKAI